MSVEQWRKKYGNIKGFNLQLWENEWYEQVIPESEIPEEFQNVQTLPGGRKQIIDLRVPGWTYNPNFANNDGSLGALIVCPEAAKEEKLGS